MTREPIRILGIDTSLRSSGVGIIEAQGTAIRALAYGRIKNPPKLSHSLCLDNIFTTLADLIEEHRPTCAAIEGAFFSRNAKTAMILGQARGAAMTACARKSIPLYEYSPRSVKQSVVGTGTAQKEQVAKMVARMLGLKEEPQEDAADALAIAICHFHRLSLPEELQGDPI